LILFDKFFKSIFRTKFEIRKFVSNVIDPSENIIIFFFIKMNDPFEVIKITIELKKHFLRIKKVDSFLNMFILSPWTIIKIFS